MFQNIAKDSNSSSNEYIDENKKVDTKNVLKNLLAKQNILLYIITFLVSMVGLSESSLLISFTPFGLAIIAAALSNYRPIGVMYDH